MRGKRIKVAAERLLPRPWPGHLGPAMAEAIARFGRGGEGAVPTKLPSDGAVPTKFPGVAADAIAADGMAADGVAADGSLKPGPAP